MAKQKTKSYKNVNRQMFHQGSAKQDFVFPYVLMRSTRYKDCWRLKYSHRVRTQCVMYDGESWSASRLSYHLNVKNIPRRMSNWKKGVGQIRFTCKHSWCVNPRHLYLDEIATKEQAELKREERFQKSLAKFPWRTKEWGKDLKLKRRNRTRRNKPGYKNIGLSIAMSFRCLMKFTHYWGA